LIVIKFQAQNVSEQLKKFDDDMNSTEKLKCAVCLFVQ
jgi:hypothetical protein